MKCQILFSGKNKKNIINLSSAENAQRVVKVNHVMHKRCLHGQAFDIFFLEEARTASEGAKMATSYITSFTICIRTDRP